MQAEQLDAEIRRLEQELAALGAIPENVDAQAARLAKVAGRFLDLGDNPIEAVADTVISTMSVFAELIGLLGPRIIVTAMARKDAPPAPRSWRWPSSLTWRRQPSAAPAPEPPDCGSCRELPQLPHRSESSRNPRARVCGSWAPCGSGRTPAPWQGPTAG